jgi:hypothetical protein
VPAGVSSRSWRTGPSGKLVPYLTRGGDAEEEEWLLADRARAVIERGGWLHLAGGCKYRVARGRIVEFGVHDGPTLGRFRSLPKSEILALFGPPDLVEERELYGDPSRTDFVYTRGIRIGYDDWDGVVDLINLGESLLFPDSWPPRDTPKP